MESGQLMLVDGRPAEYVDTLQEMEGVYVSYRLLGDAAVHWVSSTTRQRS